MIKQIKFSDIEPYINLVKKEHVSMNNPKGAMWFGIYEGDILASFYCLVISNNGKSARFKSNYTFKEFRRKGYLQKFIRHAKILCQRYGVKEMTAFCTDMSIRSHVKNKAIIQSNTKKSVFVKYIL